MKQQSMKISRQLRIGNPLTPAMLQSRSRTMRKFSKQLVLLALGLVLSSSVAFQANAGPSDPNCPTIAGNGPLRANESYAFYAFGADSSGGANATVTVAGSIETDAKGCPATVYFGFNDNGTACTGTASSVTTANASPANTGTMTWTPVTGCISSANVVDFNYANAPKSKVMYISNNGGGSSLGPNLVVSGKVQDNGGTDLTSSGGSTDGDGDGDGDGTGGDGDTRSSTRKHHK